ncbi:MAG: hypothetical protein K1X83_13950 [Oligoflexia bacterium]|nr:hypothetical protein [Oligoflexia bacterium]
MSFSATQIRRLFDLLNAELMTHHQHGELFLLGGAVLCLVYKTRQATKDIDALFEPTGAIRNAVKQIAAREGLQDDWINDAVKGFLSEKGDFAPYLELSNLSVLVAKPEYLLAMKCLAMRIGEEFHDQEDVRFLLRFLNITSYNKALAVISSYYPIEQFPQKTLYAIEELLETKQLN